MGSRTKRASDAPVAEEATPTAEAVAEATSEVPPPSHQMTDDQIAEFIRNQQAQLAAAAPAAPRKTVFNLYNELIAVVASATGRRRPQVTENTAVKVLELTLGYHLQTRHQQTQDIFPQEVYGNGSDGSEESTGPTPDETIEAAPEAAPESE